jgi:hypothetical protein
MRALFITVSFFSILSAEWKLYGTDPVFMYNSETGEVFRYFEDGGTIGFMKLNFHKNFKLKTTPSTSSNNAKLIEQQQADVQKLQQTLMNNSLNQVLQ